MKRLHRELRAYSEDLVLPHEQRAARQADPTKALVDFTPCADPLPVEQFTGSDGRTIYLPKRRNVVRFDT